MDSKVINSTVVSSLRTMETGEYGESGKFGILFDPDGLRLGIAWDFEEFQVSDKELMGIFDDVINHIMPTEVAILISATRIREPRIDGDRLSKFAWETLDHWDLEGNDAVGYAVMELTA